MASKIPETVRVGLGHVVVVNKNEDPLHAALLVVVKQNAERLVYCYQQIPTEHGQPEFRFHQLHADELMFVGKIPTNCIPKTVTRGVDAEGVPFLIPTW